MHPNQTTVFDIFSLKIVTKVHVVISACETVEILAYLVGNQVLIP